MARRIEGLRTGLHTPEKALRAEGLEGKVTVQALVAAAKPHDLKNPGYLSRDELARGAADLKAALAPEGRGAQGHRPDQPGGGHAGGPGPEGRGAGPGGPLRDPRLLGGHPRHAREGLPPGERVLLRDPAPPHPLRVLGPPHPRRAAGGPERRAGRPGGEGGPPGAPRRRQRPAGERGPQGLRLLPGPAPPGGPPARRADRVPGDPAASASPRCWWRAPTSSARWLTWTWGPASATSWASARAPPWPRWR
jgi:hypothetical protein